MLEFVVGDRPVNQRRARHATKRTRFVEIAGMQPPIVAREVCIAAADKAAVDQRDEFLRLVLRRRTKRLWLRRWIVGVLVPHEGAELVVVELRLREARPLFEHHYREAGTRKFLGDDAASGARSDDDEVDDVAGAEARRPLLFLSHVSLSG